LKAGNPPVGADARRTRSAQTSSEAVSDVSGSLAAAKASELGFRPPTVRRRDEAPSWFLPANPSGIRDHNVGRVLVENLGRIRVIVAPAPIGVDPTSGIALTSTRPVDLDIDQRSIVLERKRLPSCSGPEWCNGFLSYRDVAK
jgi:hypothetical protein